MNYTDFSFPVSSCAVFPSTCRTPIWSPSWRRSTALESTRTRLTMLNSLWLSTFTPTPTTFCLSGSTSHRSPGEDDDRNKVVSSRASFKWTFSITNSWGAVTTIYFAVQETGKDFLNGGADKQPPKKKTKEGGAACQLTINEEKWRRKRVLT